MTTQLSLLDKLTDALLQMVDCTCPSMYGLWLSATIRERARLADNEAGALDVPVGFAGWKKAKRSKYEALAMFRHAVVWRLPAERRKLPSHFADVYFTPCADEAPFSNASLADGRSTEGRTVLENVRQACADCIQELSAMAEMLEQQPHWTRKDWSVAMDLLERSSRRTLRDVLKLDDACFDEVFADRRDQT